MIKDKAKELAEAIMASQEYLEYMKAKKALEKDEKNHEILEAYRQRQWEMQLDSLFDQNDELEDDEFKEVYSALLDNENINRFLLAEYRFTKVLNEIQDILLETIDVSRDNKDDMSLH